VERLALRILLGLFVGAALAAALGPSAIDGRWLAEPLGTIFLRLLLSLVLPLAVSALVLAVAELQPGKLVGTGGRILALTLGLTSIAVGIGVALVQIVKPGVGIDRATLPAGGAITPATTDAVQAIIDLFPSNPFKAAADGNMVPILVFAVVAGLALRRTNTVSSHKLTEVIQGVFDVCAQGVQMVMTLAPVGVGAMAYMAVAKGGITALVPVANFALVAALALGLQTFVVYPIALWLLARANPLAFFRAVRPALAVAFATASSAATLPTTLRVADEGLRVPSETARFVLTVGASANQNGTALYEGVAILFICQLYGVDLTVAQQAVVVGVSVLAGVGTAGVPAASIPVIAAVVGAFGVPPEAVGVLVGVDRVLDMCRTTVNVAGDLVIARIVGGVRE
jgi:DAACS family dicarboxylate/amino acid:cation (Na+ or H+) symporter